MIIRVYEDNPQLRAIKLAVDVLQSGGLIVYPTDTIYGLGCDLHNKKALKKLYLIKGMDEKSPLSSSSALSLRSSYLTNLYLPALSELLQKSRILCAAAVHRRIARS